MTKNNPQALKARRERTRLRKELRTARGTLLVLRQALRRGAEELRDVRQEAATAREEKARALEQVMVLTRGQAASELHRPVLPSDQFMVIYRTKQAPVEVCDQFGNSFESRPLDLLCPRSFAACVIECYQLMLDMVEMREHGLTRKVLDDIITAESAETAWESAFPSGPRTVL